LFACEGKVFKKSFPFICLDEQKCFLYEQDESSGGSEVKLNTMELMGVKLIKVLSKINLRSKYYSALNIVKTARSL